MSEKLKIIINNNFINFIFYKIKFILNTYSLFLLLKDYIK